MAAAEVGLMLVLNRDERLGRMTWPPTTSSILKGRVPCFPIYPTWTLSSIIVFRSFIFYLQLKAGRPTFKASVAAQGLAARR